MPISQNTGIIKQFAVWMLEAMRKHATTAINIFPDLTIKEDTLTEIGGTVRIFIPRIIPRAVLWPKLTNRPMQDKLPPFLHNIEIERFGIGSEYDLNDLKVNVAKTRGDIEAYGQQARSFIPERALEMIALGTGSTFGLCFDGQTFFSDTHLYGTEALDNKLVGVDLNSAGIGIALAHFSNLKDERGHPMGIQPKYLMFHPSLIQKAKEAINAQIVGNNSNVFVGELILVENPFFASPKDWAVLASRKPQTAPIWYIEKEITQIPSVDDITQMFSKKVVSYGIDMTFGLSYGDFRMALYLQTT